MATCSEFPHTQGQYKPYTHLPSPMDFAAEPSQTPAWEEASWNAFRPQFSSRVSQRLAALWSRQWAMPTCWNILRLYGPRNRPRHRQLSRRRQQRRQRERQLGYRPCFKSGFRSNPARRLQQFSVDASPARQCWTRTTVAGLPFGKAPMGKRISFQHSRDAICGYHRPRFEETSGDCRLMSRPVPK